MPEQLTKILESLKEPLSAFIQTLHPYDFYSLYWLGAVAFFSLILTIILRNRPTMAGFLLLIFLSTFTVAPFVNYYFIHQYLYGTSYKLDYIKQMQFADVLLIRGTITSTGKEEITRCRLHTFVMPPQEGFMKNLQPLWVLKPIKREKFEIEERIQPNNSAEFQIKFTNFRYSKEINESDIYIYRECFSEAI